MSTNRNLVKSPVGAIQFMAATNPVKSTNDKLVYTVRLAFDSKKDKEWLDTVSKINDAKVVTSETYRGKSKETKALLATGVSLVSASSQFAPKVFDRNGDEMEEAPMFFADSTGTAQMIVQPYEGTKGGTINLIGIQIHSVEHPEGSQTDRETRLAELKAIAKATAEG
jgi:hypothetical protein